MRSASRWRDTDWEPGELDQLLAQVQDRARRGDSVAPNLCGRPSDGAGRVAGRPRGPGGDAATGKPPGYPAALGLIPSGTKKYLDHMSAFQQLGDPGVLGFAARARDWEKQVFQPDEKAITAIRLPRCACLRFRRWRRLTSATNSIAG